MSANILEDWNYLCENELFAHPEDGMDVSAFPTSLSIEIVNVSPDTKEVEDDESLNTVTNVWLEAGGWVWCDISNEYVVSHDHRLDSGASTFEEAIATMAYRLKNI